MELLAALTLILVPVALLAVYATVCAVFLVELRTRERRRATRPADRPRSERPRGGQPCRAPRPWRSRKSSTRSATSRHPLSTARLCPRSGSIEYSVAPALRR